MECDRAREAISARIDGEDPGLPASALEAHLAGCADCQDWQQRAHELTRRARLGGPFLDRDLTPQVLVAVPPAPAGRRRELARRAGLVAVALAQFAITVPLLCLGHDSGAGTHAAHELGSFDLALAIAFAIGAVRPALSAGLAWPCGTAAAGLVVTAVIDLVGGATIGADEAQHLIAAAGAALLFWQARTAGTGAAGPALTVPEAPVAPGPERTRADGQAAISWLENSRGLGSGGSDAADAASPGVAARSAEKAA
jgi:predicted anti-sigma-YlaC factor YlaD